MYENGVEGWLSRRFFVIIILYVNRRSLRHMK